MRHFKIDWCRSSTSSGYKTVYCPEHPKAWSTGHIYMHRVVMEWKLGRMLKDWEAVHHIDGDKMNNSPDNLEVMTSKDHSKLHSKKTEEVSLTCPNCSKVFKRKLRYVKQKRKTSKRLFCSRRCNGLWGRGK